jgi:hypothetical protein
MSVDATSGDHFDIGEVDKELGSPLLTTEVGWLLGLALGIFLLWEIRHRRIRRRKRRSAEGRGSSE